MNEPTPPPALSSADYEALDDYLHTSFELLEGIADVPAAWQRLTSYLQSPAGRELDPKLADFLIELFAAKCRRDLRALREDEGASAD